MTNFRKSDTRIQKSYLAIIFVTLATIISAIATFALIIDPFAIFDMPVRSGLNRLKPSVANFIRIHKAERLSRGDIRALIFGTSTTEFGYDPHHSLFEGKTAYNIGMPNSNVFEQYRYFQHALENNKIDMAVFAFDFFSFNTYLRATSKTRFGYIDGLLSTDEDGSPRYLEPALEKILVGLLSYDAAKESFKTLRYNLSHANYDQLAITYLENGERDDMQAERTRVFAGGYRKYFFNVLSDLDSVYFQSEKKRFCIYSESGHSFSSFKYLRRIIDLAKAHGVRLVLLFTPSHAAELEAIRHFGLFDLWNDWKRRVVQATEKSYAQGGPRVPVYDFQTYSKFNTEPIPPIGATDQVMSYYWDSEHLKKALGNIVFDLIKEPPSTASSVPGMFGSMLTSGMLETHFEKVEENRTAWRRGNSKQFEAIESFLAKSYRQKLPKLLASSCKYRRTSSIEK